MILGSPQVRQPKKFHPHHDSGEFFRLGMDAFYTKNVCAATPGFAKALSEKAPCPRSNRRRQFLGGSCQKKENR